MSGGSDTHSADEAPTLEHATLIDLLNWYGYSRQDSKRLAVGWLEKDGCSFDAIERVTRWMGYIDSQTGINEPRAFLRAKLRDGDRPSSGAPSAAAVGFVEWRGTLGRTLLNEP